MKISFLSDFKTISLIPGDVKWLNSTVGCFIVTLREIS